MFPSPHQSQLHQEGGLLTISRKVVLHTIHRLALGAPGVLQLGGDSIWKRLWRWFGWTLGPRGIELELADGEAAMTLTVVVHAGVSVPELVSDVRGRVTLGLKRELGIDVRTVNVHVRSAKGSASSAPRPDARRAPAPPEAPLKLPEPRRHPRFEIDP